MIFVYEKETLEFVGLAMRVLDNGRWREPTLEELYPHRDLSKLGALYVEDSLKYAMYGKDFFQFKLDENGVPIGVERKPKPPMIQLSSDQPDSDGDGLPEVPADGETTVTILADIHEAGPKGKRVQEDIPLVFRTTGGTLTQRFVLAKKGRAKVDLTSSRETVAVTVTATADGLQTGSITFEFIPPADADQLRASSENESDLDPRFGMKRAQPASPDKKA